MLRAFRRAPLAIACRFGIAGTARRNGSCARILMLHGTPRRHERMLERVLLYLRQHFEVVPLAEVVGSAAWGGEALRPRVALTFDDGLRNNVEVAYPVLRRLGTPATFFVCPQLVDSRRWLWNHEARQRLRRLAAGALARLAEEISAPAEVDGVIEAMKRQKAAARRQFEDRLRRATAGFEPTPEESHAFDVADWAALRSMDPRLVSVGSHTLSHAILTRLDAAELDAEIGLSRRILEERLERRADEFAYPDGDVDTAVRACVALSYRAAVTTIEGLVAPGADPFMLPRINVPWNTYRLALSMHSAPALPTPS